MAGKTLADQLKDSLVMARGLQGKPHKPGEVHLRSGSLMTACGLVMAKVMRGTTALWDVTCERCLAAESDRLDLSNEDAES